MIIRQYRNNINSGDSKVVVPPAQQFSPDNMLLQVLRERDLAVAGSLFLVRDENLGDMQAALLEIESMLKNSGYKINKNDQSIVEICISRITTAIRDTRQIEYFATELTRVLNACVYQAAADETSPHAKVASDICNCLFMCHDKRRVMELAVPVAIKLLISNNRQSTLVKNTTSYLALAAVSSADVIANYAGQLTEAIIKGNLALLRILPQIYGYNPGSVNAHLPAIVRTITKCSPVEKDCIIALLIASFDFISERLAYETASTLLHQLTAASPALVSEIFPLLHRFCCAFPNIVTQLLGDTYRLPDVDVYRAAHDLLLEQSHNTTSNNYAARNENISGRNYIHAENPSGNMPLSYYRNHYPPAIDGSVAAKSNSLGASKTVPYAYHQPSWYPHYEYNAAIMPVSDALIGGNAIPGFSLPTPAWKSSSAAQSRLSLGSSTINNSNTLNNVNGERIITGAAVGQRRGSRHNSIGHLRTVATNTSTSRERLLQHMRAANVELQQPPWFPSSTYTFDNGPYNIQPINDGFGGDLYARVQQDSAHPVYVGQKHQLAFNNIHPSGGWTSELNADMIRRAGAAATTIGNGSHSASSLANAKKNSSSSSFGRSRRRNNNNDVVTPAVRVTRSKTRSLSRLTKTLSKNAVSNSNTTRRPRTSHDNNTSDADEPALPRNRIAHATSGDVSRHDMPPHIINPILSQDAMQQFCERNLQKIKVYINSILVKYPLPYRCVVEETQKGQKICKLCFQCQKRGPACLYACQSFTLRTGIADIWLHLMFLALQAKSQRALGQQDALVHSLKMTFEHLGLTSCAENGGGSAAVLLLKHASSSSDNNNNNNNKSGTAARSNFAQLATSAFPNAHKQELLLSELKAARYFDVFHYNGVEKRWCCFLCNDTTLVQKCAVDKNNNLSTLSENDDNMPVCEGLLKEFRRSRLLGVQRWKSRYFSLRGQSLVRQSLQSIYQHQSAELEPNNVYYTGNRRKNGSGRTSKKKSINNHHEPSELDIGTIKCIRIIGAASSSVGGHASFTAEISTGRRADCDDDDERIRAAELREFRADERREAKSHSRCFIFSNGKDDDDDENSVHEIVTNNNDADETKTSRRLNSDSMTHNRHARQTMECMRKVLEIVTVDDNIMLLQAPDRQTAHKWLDSIKMALARHQLAVNSNSETRNNTTAAVASTKTVVQTATPLSTPLSGSSRLVAVVNKGSNDALVTENADVARSLLEAVENIDNCMPRSSSDIKPAFGAVPADVRSDGATPSTCGEDVIDGVMDVNAVKLFENVRRRDSDALHGGFFTSPRVGLASRHINKDSTKLINSPVLTPRNSDSRRSYVVRYHYTSSDV